MPTQGSAIKLTRNERRELETFVAQGKKSARAITRARRLVRAAGSEIGKRFCAEWQCLLQPARPAIGGRAGNSRAHPSSH